MDFKAIDLSLSLFNGAPTFAMDPKFNVTQHCTLETLGYNLCRVTTSTHQGTHLDAPKHFFHDGQTVDAIPVSRFAVPAFKVDLTHKKDKEPIVPADLKQWDSKIIKGASVLLETGWDLRFPEDAYFSDFPYISVELADYFADRQVNLIGLDIPTPNPKDWVIVHQTLLKNSIIIVESLCNMKEISQEKFLFIGLPLKFKDTDGSPIRAIALEGGFI
ncbi:MAG: cyclase family protein [Eubacteriales bacterium]